MDLVFVYKHNFHGKTVLGKQLNITVNEIYAI